LCIDSESKIISEHHCELVARDIPLTPFGPSEGRAEMRPHEWLGGVLGVLGLAPSARNSQINQKVLKGYAAYHMLYLALITKFSRTKNLNSKI
jgi:hypothetical protein